MPPIPNDVELVSVRMRVAAVERTDLVHVALGHCGLVLTAAEASKLARELRQAAGVARRDGRAGAGAARRAASRVASRR